MARKKFIATGDSRPNWSRGNYFFHFSTSWSSISLQVVSLFSCSFSTVEVAIDAKNTYALTNKDAILDRLGNYTTPGFAK